MNDTKLDVERLMQMRSETNTEGATNTAAAAQDVIFEKFVAYVSYRPKDIGSSLLLARIDKVKEDFKVIDIGTLAEDLPEWLDGTPIVVEVGAADKLAYKGSAALEHVNRHYGVSLK